VTLALYLLSERDCATCTDANKTHWGCNTNATIPLVLDGENLWRCPRRPYLDRPDWYNSIWQSVSYEEKGMLTEPGTWLDQPAKLVEGSTVVRTAHAEAEDTKRKAEERRRSAAAHAANSSAGGRR
jgi:hypothetical protein